MNNLKYEIGQATDPGVVRSSNEDSLITIDLILEESAKLQIGLYAIADGLGGYQGGEKASSMALKLIADYLVKDSLSQLFKNESGNLSHDSILHAMANVIRRVGNEIFGSVTSENHLMGTTLAAVLILNNTVYIANVGDSRVYLMDHQLLRQITKDHSLVAELVSVGKITKEQIYTHPQRNVVTRCLGMQYNTDVDLFKEEMKPNMSILICSDGLWEMVRDPNLQEILSKTSNPQTACEKMVDLAKQNGGMDNISVIIINVPEDLN
ncbi:MAG: Stp1/IreP family PP2C-type Ser/Thr phosphatase [Dehalococcoidales bacterium]|nr:Stp1/IreP family PP2C-type Ser/Thr phosphatase [Dehalococcoidales bacterium]